ncbi:MAG: hypothetical protein AAGF53_09860 [Pseudomonadota bacterium]
MIKSPKFRVTGTAVGRSLGAWLLKSRESVETTATLDKDIDDLAKQVILPSLPVSDEEMSRAMHQDRGQKLARQEAWDELSDKIRQADRKRLCTLGGETASLLMAYGARSDVVAAVEDALFDGAEPSPHGWLELEEALKEFPGDYPTALVVALAHIDMAWAWRNIVTEHDPERAQRNCSGHLKRAGKILSSYDAVELNSPSIGAARCALYAANARNAANLQKEYESLVDLDPYGLRHMRALGRHILPEYAGGVATLEVMARRIALQTETAWGAGGYTWVYFDALALEPRGLNLLDPEFFFEWMRDILHRRNDQHIVNLLAAFCAIAMAPGTSNTELPPHADESREHIHGFLDHILQNHLQELHPLIWSQALLSPGESPRLPSRKALIAKGKQIAMRIIASRFASQMADGSSIAFSSSGMYRLPALQ